MTRILFSAGYLENVIENEILQTFNENQGNKHVVNFREVLVVQTHILTVMH